MTVKYLFALPLLLAAGTAGYVAAPDPVTCFEDQVIMWSLDRHDHSICWNLDDLQEASR